MDDQRIVQEILAGNTEKFSELVHRFEKNIYSLSMRYSRNSEDAMDLTQEIFIKVYKNLNTFQEKGRLSTWIYRIATNACLDFVRKKQKYRVVSLTEEDYDGNESTMELPDSSMEPEELYLRQEQTSAVSAALETLSPEYKQMIILRDIQGLSYEEIGNVLQMESGTVKSRIFRARDALRKVLLTENGNLFTKYASQDMLNIKKGGGL